MELDEKPDGIGVGDNVFSEKWNIGGVVKELTTCHHCKAPSLTLVEDPHGHHHIENFKVVEKKS